MKDLADLNNSNKIFFIWNENVHLYKTAESLWSIKSQSNIETNKIRNLKVKTLTGVLDYFSTSVHVDAAASVTLIYLGFCVRFAAVFHGRKVFDYLCSHASRGAVTPALMMSDLIFCTEDGCDWWNSHKVPFLEGLVILWFWCVKFVGLHLKYPTHKI